MICRALGSRRWAMAEVEPERITWSKEGNALWTFRYSGVPYLQAPVLSRRPGVDDPNANRAEALGVLVGRPTNMSKHGLMVFWLAVSRVQADAS